MAKPRFQALVDLHAAREDEARKRVGRLEVARQELLARIAAAYAERERAAADATDARLRAIYAAYCAKVDADILALAMQVRAREAEIEKARVELIDAHRDHTTFARLRDRDAQARAADRERRAARALDDFAAARLDARRRDEQETT